MLTFFIRKKSKREWESDTEYFQYAKSFSNRIFKAFIILLRVLVLMEIPFIMFGYFASLSAWGTLLIMLFISELFQKSIDAKYIYFN